jgi:hypothetical protein
VFSVFLFTKTLPTPECVITNKIQKQQQQQQQNTNHLHSPYSTTIPVTMAPEKKSRWFAKFVEEELPSDVSGKVFVITGTTSGE